MSWNVIGAAAQSRASPAQRLRADTAKPPPIAGGRPSATLGRGVGQPSTLSRPPRHAAPQGSARSAAPGSARSHLGPPSIGKSNSQQRLAPQQSHPDLDESNPVAAFLAEAGMLQYAEALLENGFDDMDTLLDIEDADLADIGMPRGHQIRLRKRLREMMGGGGGNPQQPSGAAAAPMQQPAFGLETSRVMQPTTQMTSSVQASWEYVQSLGTNHVGGILCKQLFEIAPDAVQLFPPEVRRRYQDWMDIDELAVGGDAGGISSGLGVLFGKVINAVGLSISGLHQTDTLVPRLKQLGMRHAGYKGVTESHFPVLQKALIRTLRQVLAERFTAEIEFAWTMVYGFITAIMIEGMRDAKEISGKCQLQAAGAPALAPAVPMTPLAANDITNGKVLVGRLEPYRIERHLQKAIYGDVYEAVGTASGSRYALKALDIELVKGFEALKLQRADHQFCESPLGEIQFKGMMRGLDHVMQLTEDFEDDSHHYLVSELASGGDLLDALRLRPAGFPEDQARQLVLGAAKGLANLHLRGLAMQDVSVENMLLHVRGDGSWHVKVCDPGQASAFVVDPCTGEEMPIPFKGFVGKDFRPPELYTQDSYLATKVDAWCLGWSAFYLLVAQPMFHSAEHAAQDPDWLMFESGDIDWLWRAKGWKSTLSPEAKDFILSMMELEPIRRLSLQEALRHPWLAGAAETDEKEQLTRASTSATATTLTRTEATSPSTSTASLRTQESAHPSAAVAAQAISKAAAAAIAAPQQPQQPPTLLHGLHAEGGLAARMRHSKEGLQSLR